MTRPSLPMAALLLLLVVAVACTGDGDDDGSPTTTAPATTATTSPPPPLPDVTLPEPDAVVLGPDDRPARLVAPAGEEATEPAPLLLLLHGYTSTADEMNERSGVTELAQPRGVYVLLAEGSPEPDGDQFWDAHPACCNFTGTPVDDVGYLRDLVLEAVADHPIDPDRVYVVGYSNGGFMAYRLACEMADELAAIVVVAGSDRRDEDDCVPSRPVSVLHIHGTEDRTIPYAPDGTAPFPGAVEVTARWARRAECDPAPVDRGRLDLEETIVGPETIVTAYEGCAEGTDVQLDTMEGVDHLPQFDDDQVGTEVLDWLLAHSR